jgi:hypothetical protein
MSDGLHFQHHAVDVERQLLALRTEFLVRRLRLFKRRDDREAGMHG